MSNSINSTDTNTDEGIRPREYARYLGREASDLIARYAGHQFKVEIDFAPFGISSNIEGALVKMIDRDTSCMRIRPVQHLCSSQSTRIPAD